MARYLMALLLALVATAALAESVLINDVRIFNGVDAKLTQGNVLITDGKIAAVSQKAIEAPADTVVVDGGNRILTPGFIDLHVHLTMHAPASQPNPHATALGAYAVGIARFYLDHGFTTIRDAGGTHPDLARSFNTGLLYGPRVFPSGAIVSQTAGHGDWRDRHEANPAHTGGNRILTPGFIDLHVHLTMHAPASQPNPHATALGAYAVGIARFYLDHGFTTIRDAGGTHPDLAHSFNTGLLYGPRVFPSGAIVSQTAGHGDWRGRHEANPAHTGGNPYTYGGSSILADGVDPTLVAVRENLKNGATQIKIMGGGGVMSDYDPIHSLQPSPAEIRAAVQAAGDWGTYVLAHAYTSEAITRLVENGVKCIEHGLLIDDATAKLVADNDVVISTQLVIFRSLAAMEGLSDNNREKALLVRAGQENLIRLIKKYDITTGFSTDFIMGQYQGLPREFTERALFWTPAEVLRQATSESARVIRMAGKLNRHGNFGEIREGWVADLLLHEGELLEDLAGLADPESNLALIMKDGKIIKNRL